MFLLVLCYFRLGHGCISGLASSNSVQPPSRVETLHMLRIQVLSVACGAQHTVALTQQGVGTCSILTLTVTFENNHTFENNFEIKPKFAKYSKESSCLPIKNDFFCKIFPKSSVLFRLMIILSQ